MSVVYLIIIWSVCLAYVGLNLYYKDFWGRVFAVIILFVSFVLSIYIMSN